jgi:hypothetical protein
VCVHEKSDLDDLEKRIVVETDKIIETDPKAADAILVANLVIDRATSEDPNWDAFDKEIDEVIKSAAPKSLKDALAGNFPTCEENLKSIAAVFQARPQSGLVVPNCKDAWLRFAKPAAQLLEANPAARDSNWSNYDKYSHLSDAINDVLLN